jgi:WS/DGAT/MGAT family acyltransferase
MRQLDAQDAALLASSTRSAHGNVTFVHIYNQTTAPGGRVRFKDILLHIDSRLDRLPLFRQKLHRVPLDLDAPFWIDDEHFDLEHHVRHIALPKPGDWRQFCIQVSRIHARPLDLNRPLWEVYVIEGLDSFVDLPVGSFAVIVKTHFTAVDAEGAADLTAVLHESSPTAGPPPPSPPWFAEEPPGAISLLTWSAASAWRSPFKQAASVGRGLVQRLPYVLRSAVKAIRHPGETPVTRFNAAISQYRVFDTRRFELDNVRRICGLVDGASVDDVALAVCGGALRKYLEMSFELPATSLQASVPVSVRAPNGAGDEQALSWMHLALGTDIADPIARLASIREQTAASVTAESGAGITPRAPTAGLDLAGEHLGRAMAQIGRRAPLANCTVMRLPAPDAPLYLCGAHMTYFSAILPIADGMGLVFAITRCEGFLIVSPTSCRELMPDPEAFAQCLRDSYQEYLAAALAGKKAKATKQAKRKSGPTKTHSRAKSSRSGVSRASAPVPRPASTNGRRRPTRPAA